MAHSSAQTRPAAGPKSVDEHRADVRALLPHTPVRTLPLAECLGLVLAEELSSTMSLPPFDNSAMDGYALRVADIAAASESDPVQLPVTGDIPAGQTEIRPLEPGTAQRIMTGAPMPPGADGILPVERTDGGVRQVRCYAPTVAGQHLRRAGDDVRPGDVVLPAGAVLGPAQLGIAAAIGRPALPCRARPRVLVLSTGSELIAPGGQLAHGQIFESNGTMLTTAITAAGGYAEQLHFVPDDVAAFHAALAPHLSSFDLLVTSGGVSAGAYEVVKDAFAGSGVEFVKVALQPGGPQGFGSYGGLPVITLPGNPVSAQVSFEMFVRPALRAAMGHARPDRPQVTAALAEAVTSPAGRRQYRRGRYADGALTLIGGPGSHLLASLAASNCLVRIPEEVEELPAGAEVQVLLLDE